MLSQMLADYAEANDEGKQDMYEEAAERMVTAEKALINVSGELVRLQAIEAAALGLVEYRRRAGPLNFQLEKADDFIGAMANALLDAKP